MNILVLGCTGMLGHMVFRYLSKNLNFSVWGTKQNQSSDHFFLTEELARVENYVSANNFQSVVAAVYKIKPSVIINCIGIIKQRQNALDCIENISINALFPHKLAKLADETNSRLINISTDCVFFGDRGNYSEIDTPDAKDIYGKSKCLGEVEYGNALTIRTSIIGPELTNKANLLEWVLRQKSIVNGYNMAFFSGLTTLELSKILERYAIFLTNLSGLYHVSGEKISKHDLILKICHSYKKALKIVPDYSVVIDRSLVCTKFMQATGYQIKDWDNQLVELVAFQRNYSSSSLN